MVFLRPIVMVALLGSTAGVASADTDSLSDYFGPREAAVGESMRGAARGALSITLNPAGLALDRQLVFEGSYGYRGGDGASVVGVSACDSTVPVPGCFYYRYFGAEPSVAGGVVQRRAHEFGGTVSRAINPRLSTGVNLRYFDYNSELTGEEDASGFTTDAGITFRASEAVSLGVVGYNLVAADSPQYPRGIGSGLALRPIANLGISFDAVWNLDRDQGTGKARYGGGAEYFLRAADGQNGYPLRLGGIYDAFSEAGYITGGFGLATLKLGLDVSARRQVSGPRSVPGDSAGDEFAVFAGLRLFGPADASM